MGKIFLNQISVCTIIGTLPHERVNPQRLTLDIEITVPMKNAALSDDLNDALDYSAVEKEVVETVEKSSFKLLEALINAVGTVIVAHKEVISCRVRIDKPAASKYGRSVAVEAEFTGEGICQ